MKSIVLFLVFPILFFAQAQDSLIVNQLNSVVVTGQIEAQSIKKSVHNVRVISQADIKNLAANNLGDVLNQYLNITVRPSGSSGRSSVSMFGLDAQYFKILVDNIPLVNENGLGNNVDLSQINLNDIERIEIVEGAMGVTHGANAVSGILNIITKKSNEHKWEISTTLQEETVGNEYSLFNQGRHIQNIKIGHNFNENWFASIGINRNDFQGFQGDRKGDNYAVNDGQRGFRWLPKEQYNSTALINYRKNNFKAFYKFEWLDEQVDFYNNVVQSGFNETFGVYRFGEDSRFSTSRFFHHLNTVGKIADKINFNISVSHQNQERYVENFRNIIGSNQEINNREFKDQGMEVFYSLGNFSNFLSSNKVNLQLGYEIVSNKGFSLVAGENNTTKTIRETLTNFDLFAVSEINLSETFSFRPGARYSFQSDFENQYALSLGTRKLLKDDLELRASVGKSFRTPNFEELYTEIIFSGHFFVGNENLTPEQSTSYEASIKKQFEFNEETKLAANIISSYLNIKDKIDVALIGFDTATSNPMYQFINVSKYNMWNIASNNQFQYNNLQLNFGASLVGISRVIDNGEFQSNDDYLYNFNWNASAAYTIKKWNTTAAMYYKFTGKSQQYVAGSQGFVLSDIDSYSWMDASLQKAFNNNKWEVTIGARNLFNITNIEQTNLNQGGGHAVASQILLGYGTSYFTRLTYNLNF